MSPSDRTPPHDALLEHHAFLRRLARSLVADEHRAEDLAQESVLAALRRPPRMEGSTRAWLARVVRRLASNAARDEGVRANREADAPEARQPRSPEQVAQQIETQQQVLAALARLEEPTKSTLFMRYWDDLTPSAIAARTGVPVSTVKTRLARGLERMRRAMDEGHGESRGAWVVALAGGIEGWERVGLGAAAAAGGVAMGTKLALGAAVVGGGVVFGTWWALQPAAEPEAREIVERPVAEESQLAVAEPPALLEPDSEPRSEVRAQVPSVREFLAAEREEPAWGLDLELIGWDPADTGPVAIEIRGPDDDSPAVTLEHSHAERISADVSELFSDAGKRPDHLRVKLDHPRYLPLEAAVLVPEEFQRVETNSGRMQIELHLVRASAIVLGTVSVEGGAWPGELRVALYAMERDQPSQTPAEEVRPSSEGAFRLRANTTGEHAVLAHARSEDGKPSGLRPETRLVNVRLDEVLEIDPIVVGEGATLSGQVTVLGDIEGCSGNVHMTLLPRSWSSLAWKNGRFETRELQVRWDEDGRFRASGLAPSLYKLSPVLEPIRGSKLTSQYVGPDANLEILAPNTDVRINLSLVRVTFVVVSGGVPVPDAPFTMITDNIFGGFSADMRHTDDQGRISAVLEPSTGFHCKVGGEGHAARELRFLPAELAAGGPIEIELDETLTEPATLAIQFGADALQLAENVLLDVLLYDRSDPEAMSFLKNGSYRGGGRVATVSLFNKDQRAKLSIEADRTQVVSGIPAGTYVVSLAPRFVDPERTCLLAPDRFEVDLRPGERVDREWFPEVGGGLRVNIDGSGAWVAWLHDGSGERMNVMFRSGTSTSTGIPISGVSESTHALPAGPYELRFNMKDKTTRVVPIYVEAGRVNDVEVDLDKL